MKKLLFCLLFITAILLSSCKNSSGSDISSINSLVGSTQSENSGNSSENISSLNSIQGEITEPYVKLNIKEDATALWGLAVDDNTVLMSYKTDKAATSMTVIKYDVVNGTYETVGEVKDYTTMSDDQIVINGCLYYVAQINQESCGTLVCIDYKNNKASYPCTFDYFPPFGYYDTLSEDSFALFMPESGGTGNNKYHVGIYNTITNTYNDIITEQYTQDGGTIVQDVECKNGNVYLSCGLYKNGNYTQAIREYDTRGNLLNEYKIGDLPEKLKQDDGNIYDFYLAGDYCFFKTLGSAQDYLYKFTENGFDNINLPAETLSFVTQKMGIDIESFPYAYFWDNDKHIIYILDLQSGEFTSWDFELEEENMGLFADNHGNVLLSSYSSEPNSALNYYYIPAKTILNNAIPVQ